MKKQERFAFQFRLAAEKGEKSQQTARIADYGTKKYWTSILSDKKRIAIVLEIFQELITAGNKTTLADFDLVKKYVWQKLKDDGKFDNTGLVTAKQYKKSADEFWSGYWARQNNQNELTALKNAWDNYQDTLLYEDSGNLFNKDTDGDGKTDSLGITSILLWGFGGFIVVFLVIKLMRRK